MKDDTFCPGKPRTSNPTRNRERNGNFMINGLSGFILILLLFFLPPQELQAQCESSPAICQPDMLNGHGPDPCMAKVYCSNSGAVESGLISCTNAADTDGCGIEADNPQIGIYDAAAAAQYDHLFNGSECETGNYLQWMVFATPPNVDGTKIQGVGASDSWFLFHAGSFTDTTGDMQSIAQRLSDPIACEADFEFVACSDANQYETFSNDNAVLGDDVYNVYYIAFFYDTPTNGSLNFKIKECEYECPAFVTTCPIDVFEESCQSQADIDLAFGNFLDDFSASGGSNSSVEWFVDGQSVGMAKPGLDLAPDECGGSVTIGYTITDDCNEPYSCEATFTVEADETPVALDPIEDYTLEECNADWPEYLTTNWTDNCGVGGETSGTLDSDGGGMVSTDGCMQSRDYTFSVTDDCGNETEMVVTVSREFDETPVALDPIEDYTLEECNADWPEYLTTNWTDNCGVGGETSGTLDSDGGGMMSTDGCIQSRDYTFSVTDDCGNETEMVVTVSREFDETPVALDPIEDYTLEECNADWPEYLTTNWTDNCGVGGETSGTLDSDGGGMVSTDGCMQSRDYTFSVTDDCGNETEMVVTVSREFDETPVALDPIEDYTLEECNADWPEYLTTNWTDNCGVGGETSGTLDSDGGGMMSTDGCIQSRDYTFSVTDDCGNETEMVVTVSREFDETPVALDPIEDYTLEECNADWPEYLTTNWTDNCGVGGETSGTLDSDGGGMVSTDGCMQSRDYTFSVTDDCGNETEMVVTVSREFDETPVALDPIEDYTLEECNADWPEYLTTNWTDNCGVGGETSGTLDSDGGGMVSTDGCIQSRDYTFSVTDDCGNETEMVVTVSREFDETPVALDPIEDYTLEECNADWPEYLTTNWTDNCGVGGETSGTLDSDGGGMVSTDGCIQSRDYTFSVTDDCGNETEMVVTVSREFDETPVALDPIEDYTLEECNADWPEYLTTNWTDNCGVGGETSGTLDSDGGGMVSTDGCIQRRDYTFSVTDDCGNETEMVVTVSREFDETAPVIIPPTIETVCELEVPASLTASWTDNCSAGGELTAYPVMVGSDDCSETFTYTFTVTDDCGNTAEEVLTVVREWEIVDNCETIFGYNADASTCFSEYGFNRWGWTNSISEGESFELSLYAGAAKCMPGKGTPTGTASVTYMDGYITVEYNLMENYVLNEAHVYIGCDPVPSMKNGKETVAPGQYNFNPDLDGGVQNYTVGPIEATGDLYIIVHGVACEIICECTVSGIIDGDEGGQSFNGAQVLCGDANADAELSATNKKETEAQVISDVKTFPVPFKETVNVEYDFEYTSDVQIDIFNMRGNHLRTYNDKNVTKGSVTNLQVDFALKANQMYILKVTTDRETFVKQIISSKK
jgi:hypothetical protein